MDRFGEVSVPIPVPDEIEQYRHIHDKDCNEDDIEQLLIALGTAAGILLHADGRIEILVIALNRGVGVVPEHVEWSIL